MSIHVETIVSQLPMLSADELSKVRQLTDMLMGSKPETEATDPTERIMFEALKAELASVGIRNTISYSAFSETKQFKGWKKGIKVVSEFTERSFKGYVKNDAQLLGLCRVYMQALINEFKRGEIPISVGTLANNVHRVPQAFDRAFPNYLQSGLAYLVPQAMMRGKKT